MGAPIIPGWGWSTFFLDYDNDGWKDLFAANGHVYPEVDGKIREKYRQPLQLFRNVRGGKFQEVSSEAGLSAMRWRSARGGAYCDFDNDGDIDILISNIDDGPATVGGIRVEMPAMGGVETDWHKKQSRCDRRTGKSANWRTGGAVIAVRAGGSYLSGQRSPVCTRLWENSRCRTRSKSAGRNGRMLSKKANQIIAIKEGTGVVPYSPQENVDRGCCSWARCRGRRCL